MGNDQLDVMDLDEFENEEQRLYQKRKKKKKHTLRNVLIVLALLGAGLYGYGSFAAKNTTSVVEVYTVGKDDLQQIVSISGTVVTGEEKSYYAKVPVPVESIPFSVGDSVKKGDVLISFDAAKLDLQQQTTSLSQAAQTGNYDNSMQQNAKNWADLAEANANLPVLEQQVDFINDWIQELTLKITEKQQRMQQTHLELQQALTAEQTSSSPDKDKIDKLNELIYDSQSKQTTDAEINAWKKQVEDLQQELVKYQQDKAEMESQQKTSEASVMNPGAINALNANQQSSALQTGDALSSLSEAAAGIVADFDGVVTELSIREGATPAQGMELIHIASTEDVKVLIQITKSDLEKVSLGQDVKVTIAGHEYDGKVSKIAGNATRNAGGMVVVNAEVQLTAPDEHVILGAEADTDIHTQFVKDAVVLPYEYINTDSAGDFVNTVTDGQIKRVPITIGITTDTLVEITGGLAPGTEVTALLPDGVEEGTKVETVPVTERQSDMAGDMMNIMVNNMGQ